MAGRDRRPIRQHIHDGTCIFDYPAIIKKLRLDEIQVVKLQRKPNPTGETKPRELNPDGTPKKRKYVRKQQPDGILNMSIEPTEPKEPNVESDTTGVS